VIAGENMGGIKIGLKGAEQIKASK